MEVRESQEHDTVRYQVRKKVIVLLTVLREAVDTVNERNPFCQARRNGLWSDEKNRRNFDGCIAAINTYNSNLHGLNLLSAVHEIRIRVRNRPPLFQLPAQCRAEHDHFRKRRLEYQAAEAGVTSVRRT